MEFAVSFCYCILSFLIPAFLAVGHIQCSLDNSTAFRDSSKSDPVTMSFSHPAVMARDMTERRSAGCRCVS